LDIGTKSIKAFVYKNGSELLFKKKIQTSLGEHLDNQRISQPGIDMLVDVINNIIKETAHFDINQINAFGTEVFRRAENIGNLQKQIKEKTPVDIQVIDNQKELELYWTGLVRDFEHDGMIAAIDIGGGSVQFLYGDKNGLKGSHHLNTGTVFVHKQFIGSEPPTENEYKAIEQYIAKQIADINITFPKGTPFIHGSSSVIDFYTEAKLPLEKYTFSPPHPYKIGLSEIDKFYKKLRSLPEEQRETFFPSDPGFTKGASIGFAQIIQIAKKTGLTYIVPSNNSLIHGFL